MYYKDFMKAVKSLDGVWATEDVYFSQTRDQYCACYKPLFPDNSIDDARICEISRSGAYLRGDFELVQFNKAEGKVTATYFASFKDLEQHIKKEKW